MENRRIRVRYLQARGGSGMVDLWAEELVDWVHRKAVSDDPVLVIDLEYLK